jgi:DNA polymerase
LGHPVTIGKHRGTALARDGGSTVFVTIHPSALLRLRGEAEKQSEYDRFVADLRKAAGKSN